MKYDESKKYVNEIERNCRNSKVMRNFFKNHIILLRSRTGVNTDLNIHL